MATYGWTLDEALSHTLPQVMELLGAMKRWPPINLVTPILLRSMGGGKEANEKVMLDKLKGISGVDVTSSAETRDFFRRLGVEGSGG